MKNREDKEGEGKECEGVKGKKEEKRRKGK